MIDSIPIVPDLNALFKTVQIIFKNAIPQNFSIDFKVS